MFYGVAASLVMLLHALFVVFVMTGGFLVLRWPWLAWIHVPAFLWGTIIEFGGWVCPLTPLENHLRRMAGEAGYDGDFVEHYILPMLYPEALTREVQIGLGVLVLLVNGIAYGILLHRHRS